MMNMITERLPRSTRPGKDYTGLIFGHLLALKRVFDKRRNLPTWLCLCICGKHVLILPGALSVGKAKSCGCMTRSRTHGMAYSSEWNTYHGAHNRCTNPTAKYWYCYGGRGIKFNFASFEEFFATLGRKPTPQHSLDRIDNNGNYEPGNVRWATRIEQQRNKRNTPKRKYALALREKEPKV